MESTPQRKSRRIIDDEESEDDFPTLDFKRTKAPTPQAAEDKSDEEIDDEGLFSDEEADEKEENQSSSRKRSRAESELFDDEIAADDETRYDEHAQRKRAPVVQEQSLPNLSNPAPSDGQMYHLELPKILHLGQYPFDPSVTLPGPESEAFTHPLSTIRHRKTPDGPRSNARFLKWSDGSMSLVLGAEMYDVPINPVPKAEQQFLVLSHHQAGLLRVAKRIDAGMKMVPVSTASGAHKRLVTKQIGKGVQIERRAVKEFQPEGDPEAMKRLAEKAIEEKIRSRKKLDAKRKQTSVRFGGMRSERIMEDEGEHHIGVGRYDDEGDGFVVSDDEEEIEERGGRLARIKAQGAEKYKNRRRDESEEEEEEEAEETEGEDDSYNDRKQDTPRKSRRRIVDDDDDED
jgi:RNA polymerase-associated protein LEO1